MDRARDNHGNERMYIVLEYLICVLLALMCTGVVFAAWTALILAKEGAKILRGLMGNFIYGRGQMQDRSYAFWKDADSGPNTRAIGGRKSMAPTNYPIGRPDAAISRMFEIGSSGGKPWTRIPGP